MPAAKAYASEVNVTILGMLNITVDLVPAKRGDAKISLKTISPIAATPTPLRQVYIDDVTDPDNPQEFTAQDMHRAKEVTIDGTKKLVRVTAEEIEAVKTPLLPVGEANVSPYPAADVEALTRPGGTLYYLRPSANKKKVVPPAQRKIYHLVLDALTGDDTKAWVCELTVRDTQKMFRLTSWNGHLLLQELIRPGEFNEVEVEAATYDERLLQALTEAATAQVKPFDPAAHANFYRERAEALDAAKRSGDDTPIQITVPSPDEDAGDDDLLAMLTASVAAATPAKKAPAKRAAAKKKAPAKAS